MNEKILSIEKASLDAWPALNKEIYDGWVLRFSKGYTKRANSVNVLGESKLPILEKVKYCEKSYQERHLPTIFRITPLSPPELDITLESNGYQILHPTWVMTRSISDQTFNSDDQKLFQVSFLDHWIKINSKLGDIPPERESIHMEMLRSIKTPCLYASLEDGDIYLSCGLGVVSGLYFGLFDVVTNASFRKQGFATNLVLDMLDWAKKKGANSAYLQVMEENSAARKLYRKLGFLDLFQYWYRVPGR